MVFGAEAAARAAEHLAPPSLLALLHQRLEEGHEHAGPAQPSKRFQTLFQSPNSAGSVRETALRTVERRSAYGRCRSAHHLSPCRERAAPDTFIGIVQSSSDICVGMARAQKPAR